MKKLLFLMLIGLYITPAFADVIGCDADGIVCLNDDLEIYSNEFRTLDLDFDGKYELYYFDVNGRLKTNNYVNDYYLNEKGQQTIGGNISIVDIGPEVIKTYQVDNTDYYYRKIGTDLNIFYTKKTLNLHKCAILSVLIYILTLKCIFLITFA